MKFLASITIVLSLPTIVGSLWGMNLSNLPFSESIYGFPIVFGIAVFISIAAFLWLKKKDML
jgi:magnesium transporter